MRYSVQFDSVIERWVVVDTIVAEVMGVHRKLAPAQRQAGTLEDRWMAFKSFYLEMARAPQAASQLVPA